MPRSRRSGKPVFAVVAFVFAVLAVCSSAAAAGSPPETSITNYDIYYDNADFWFGSDAADATFECRLDGAVFGACGSPVAYRALPEGQHTFEVRAVDSAGLVDDSPANLTFMSAPKPPPPPPAPDNDSWYGAQALSGTDGSVQGTTVNATTQWDEPFNPAGSAHTVWYVWTAGRTADVTFTAAGEGFAPRVTIFTGTQTSNAYAVATDVGSATTRTYAGLEYHVSVDGVDGGTGPFTLSWEYAATGPANDYLAEAETITGESGSLTASNVGATVEPNEPRHDGTAGENADGHSIWYRWNAPAAGTAIFTTEGSSFDTSLRAYTESPYGQLVGQGWSLPDLNPWTSWSRLQLNVHPGETYLIAVDGANGATGEVQLRWRTAVDTGDLNGPGIDLISPEPGTWTNGTVTFLADAWDDEGVDRVVYEIAPNGSGFPWFVGESQAPPYEVTLDTSVLDPGLYSVFATAYDASGNGSSFSTTITVGSVPPPTLSVPSSITVEATGPTGAIVKWTVSATDYTGRPLPVSCSRKSGTVFPLGTTKVTCSTTDAYGNTAAKAFAVRVLDTTAPKLTVPSTIVVDAVAPSGAVASFTTTAVDRVSGAVVPQCSPASGSTFAIGDTTVTCTAADQVGNAATATFVVHVKGAAEQLSDLRALVDSMSLDSVLAARLRAQLDDIGKQLAQGRTNAVCGGLAELLSLVQKESGKHLSAEQADRLGAGVLRIRGVVAC